MQTDHSARELSERLARLEARNAKLEADLASRPSPARSQPPSSLVENILATTGDAVIATDAGEIVTYLNRSAEHLYRVKAADTLGKRLSEIHGNAWLNPEDEQRYNADLAKRGSWKGEHIHIRRDGTELIVSSTVNVLPEECGGGTVALIRDVTTKKQSELEIRRQAAQLVRANEDLTHFAYAVSHDLQAPLRTVVSFSQLLSIKYAAALDERGTEFLRLVVEGGNRMAAMIRDLLRLAKSAGDEGEFAPAVSMEETLSAALENLRSEVQASGAIITHQNLPVVTADSGQLVQLFQNLIGNSLKYQKPGIPARILISSERADDEWIVSVSDNGIGFKTEYAAQIFDVFKRLHGNQYSGTGIGLTICKRIVERRGGRIWAESVPGQGAKFLFSIPDVITHEIAQPQFSAQAAAPVDLSVASAPFDELFATLDLAHAIVRDMEGKILIWTKGAERLFQWSKDEAVGQHVHTLLKTEFPVPLSEIQVELLLKGEWKGQLKKHRKDGSVVWLASHWALYRDGSGRGQSVIEVPNDITALKGTEQSLEESANQRDLALRAGQMGIWRWDTRTGKVEWDETIERLHGMPPGSFEGTFAAVQKRTHPADLDLLLTRIAEAFERGLEYTVEYRALRLDGSSFWVRGQGEVVRENGIAVGMHGVVWDIAYRKQLDLDRQFLLDLSAKLTGDPAPAMLAIKELAQYAGLQHCTFIEIDLAAKLLIPVADSDPSAIRPNTAYPLEIFGPVVTDSQAGQLVAISDTEIDPRTAESHARASALKGTRACLSVPLHRDGVWRACLVASQDKPRIWTEREIALLRDVAERLWPVLHNSRLVHLLEERSRQFQGTFEQAAVGIGHSSLDGRFLLVNQRFTEIVGYPKEELLAKTFQDITHPDDLESNMAEYDALKRGEKPAFSIEKRFLPKNGPPVWTNVTVSLVRDATGIPQFTIAVIEDISARKKALAALEASNRLAALRLREIEAIYSQAPVGLLFLDKDLRFVRINDHLAEINGVPADGHIGRTLDEVLPDLGPTLISVLRGVFETRKPLIDMEISGVTPSQPGVTRTWLTSYFPVEGGDGAIIGLNGVVREITEHKRSEAALFEAGERLRIATAAAQLGVFVWDAKQDCSYWENEQMYRITGRTHEQGPANTVEFLKNIIYPEDAAVFERDLTAAAKQKEPFHNICRIRRGDGAIRHVEFSGLFDFADDGAPVRLTGVMADITNRIEAEQAARLHDEQLRRMIDSIEQLAWMARADGYIYWYNHRWYEYTGTTPEQMEGWGWQSLHDPKVLPEVMERWAASIRTGEAFDMVFPLKGKDGVFRSFLTRIVPVRDSSGELVRWFGTNTNVDDLQREQDALRESERKFRELAESLPQIVWTGDSQGNIVYTNSYWHTYTGVPPGDVHNLPSLMHPDDVEDAFKKWEAALTEGVHYETETRIRRHDGIFRWCLNRAEPIRNERGDIVKWLGTSTDIHEQKLTEQALRRSNAELEQFGYAASHDLQEPLRLVTVYSELLSKKLKDNAEAEKCNAFISGAAKKMDSLLRGILEYSRTTDATEAATVADTNAALESALQNLAASVKESEAVVTHDHLPPILFPETQLVQVFQNLIGNAIKYRGGSAPRIHVSAVIEGAYCKFAVSDNGIGIAPEHLERIFGIFKRLHTSQYPGVGIGLAICKRLVERQGGRIWAESQVGVGTTFYFSVFTAKQ